MIFKKYSAFHKYMNITVIIIEIIAVLDIIQGHVFYLTVIFRRLGYVSVHFSRYHLKTETECSLRNVVS
jgi:hypothetical protein